VFINYFARLLVLTFFIIPFRRSVKRKLIFGSVITGIYVCSAFLGMFISEQYLPWHNFSQNHFASSLVYCVLNLPLLFYVSRVSIDSILLALDFTNVMLKLTWIFAILGVLSVGYQFNYALQGLYLSAANARQEGISLLPANFTSTIASGLSLLSLSYTILFYLSVSKKKHVLLSFLLFLSSFNIVLNVLTVNGRDGIAIFVFGHILFYLIYREVFSKKIRHRIRSYGTIVTLALMLIFVNITADRFYSSKSSASKAFVTGVMNYLGMQQFTFNDVFIFHKEFSYGKGNFPILFGEGKTLTLVERGQKMAYTYNFSGYVGSFYKNGGFIYSAFVIYIFMFLFKGVLKVSRRGFGNIFIIGLLTFFMFTGLFYFRLGTLGGNRIFALILLYILIEFLFVSVFKKYEL